MAKIERKTAAIALLLLTAFAAVIGGLIMTTQATETNSTSSTIEDLNSNANMFSARAMLIDPHKTRITIINS